MRPAKHIVGDLLVLTMLMASPLLCMSDVVPVVEPISADEAAHSFDEVTERLAALKRAGMKEQKCPDYSKDIVDLKYNCFQGFQSRMIFAAPFPAVLPEPSDGIRPPSSRRMTYGWAPVSKVLDGRDVVGKWRFLAQENTAFNCDKTQSCLAIFNSSRVAPHSGTGDLFRKENSLAVCTVQQINGTSAGAPIGCRPILIIDGDQLWVRIKAEQQADYLSGGGKDFDLNISVPPSVSLDEVMNAGLQALVGLPLVLNVSKSSLANKFIFGSSSHRDSMIFPPYREWISIRVDIEPLEDRKNTFLLTVSTNLLVNLRPTDTVEEWHPPSMRQQEMFLHSVMVNLRTSLSQLCPSAHWSDLVTLSCR